MIQAEGIFVGGGSDISAPIIGKDFNWTGGDGTYQVFDDGDGNWRIKFLSSGLFTPLKDMIVDAFILSGGGSGAKWGTNNFGAGGGGGYTKTYKSILLTVNTDYQITVGEGGAEKSGYPGNRGGSSAAFGFTVEGGYGGGAPNKAHSAYCGGDGGSGGGAINGSGAAANGGSDGSDGGGSGSYTGGTGQGTTTREFGETEGDLYAGGGGGYSSSTAFGIGGAGGGANGNMSAAANTGGGGGGLGKAGGSGIVIIRKHKEAVA